MADEKMKDYERGFWDASVLMFECLAEVLFPNDREKSQITEIPNSLKEGIREIQQRMEDYPQGNTGSSLEDSI